MSTWIGMKIVGSIAAKVRITKHYLIYPVYLTIPVQTGGNSLADLFPTGPTGVETQPVPPPSEAEDEESLNSMLETVTHQLKSIKVVTNPESQVPRPGSSYTRWRLDTDLPEKARPFYETAAKVVGISLSTLVRAVSQTELRLAQWQEDRRRMEYHGEPMDMELAEYDDDEFEGVDEYK